MIPRATCQNLSPFISKMTRYIILLIWSTWYCYDHFDHTEININPSQRIPHIFCPGSLLFCFPVREGRRETCCSPFILLIQPGIACSCKQPLPFSNCISEDSGRSTCSCMLPLSSVQHSFSECCCWIAVSAFNYTAVISAEGTLPWPSSLFHDGCNTSHGSWDVEAPLVEWAWKIDTSTPLAFSTSFNHRAMVEDATGLWGATVAISSCCEPSLGLNSLVVSSYCCRHKRGHRDRSSVNAAINMCCMACCDPGRNCLLKPIGMR